MKTLGIIGGIAPESTIDYYRQLIAAGVKSIVINSIDVDRVLALAAKHVTPSVSEMG